MPLTSQTSRYLKRPVLVFLPSQAASTIVSKLEQAGYPAAAVSSIPDLFDALRSEQFAIAVTIRPEIDIVRNIKWIPVVNLEVFFHMALAADRGDVNGKQFDIKAFVHRIDALTAPRPHREVRKDTRGVPVTPSQHVQRRSLGWWNATKNLVGRRTLVRTVD